MRKSKIKLKSDERIWGDGDFVNHILPANDEAYERRYAFKARGLDVDFIDERVS